MNSQIKNLITNTNISRVMFTRGQRAKFASNGLKVYHNPKESEFVINLDTHKAFLKYSQNGSLIELEHTEVPEVFRGKGVGKLLAEEAFEYAVKNDLKMKIHCDYAEKVFNENKTKYWKYVVN